jgi:hypothetical protein
VSASSRIVVVDLHDPEPAVRVESLRQGEGKLLGHIERIVDDLVEAGTVSSAAQTVVVVVREALPFPFGFFTSRPDDDEDEDEDDD